MPALQHISDELSVHLSFVSELQQLTESCYVTYSKILRARFSSAQHPTFHFNLLHTFKKGKKGCDP